MSKYRIRKKGALHAVQTRIMGFWFTVDTGYSELWARNKVSALQVLDAIRKEESQKWSTVEVFDD